MTSKKVVDAVKKIMTFSVKRNGYDKVLEKVYYIKFYIHNMFHHETVSLVELIFIRWI